MLVLLSALVVAGVTAALLLRRRRTATVAPVVELAVAPGDLRTRLEHLVQDTMAHSVADPQPAPARGLTFPDSPVPVALPAALPGQESDVSGFYTHAGAVMEAVRSPYARNIMTQDARIALPDTGADIAIEWRVEESLA